MGLFKESDTDLEEKLEKLKLENQIETEKSDTLEKRILQKQLRKKYGKNWRNMVGNIKDNETLRQFASAGAGFDLSPRKAIDHQERNISVLPNKNSRLRMN